MVTDEAAGFRLAAQHLIDLGHRELRFIGGEGSITATVQKVQALKAVLEENGLPFRPDTVLYGGFSIASGRELMGKVLAVEKRPTAVMCVNDNVAVGAVKAALEAGVQIPGDLSITGFDDTLLASSITPELTTVSQNSHALGEQAVQLLHQMVSGEKVKKLTVLEPRLICRQSTGPAAVVGKVRD
ncbi:HTH-type transcriptional regulator DegA [compost metagenome]